MSWSPPFWSNARLYACVFGISLAASFAGVLLTGGPVTNGGDEFAYLLGAQTYAAGRLTNPPHPFARFFETFHVLQRPSYMSKYPPAQSLVLAAGYRLGHPIFGVWLAGGCFAVATAWMLRSRLAARWSLLGGALTVLQFGGTHYYAQSYWGGAVAATGGALIAGATLRLLRAARAGDACWLGIGAAIGLLSRPFETSLLCLGSAALFVWRHWRASRERGALWRSLLRYTLPWVVAAAAFQARINAAVTGDWRQLPYTVYESSHSSAPLFVWQSSRPTPVFDNPVLEIYNRNFVVPFSRFTSPLPVVWAERAGRWWWFSLGPVLGGAALLGSAWAFSGSIRKIWLLLAVPSAGFVLSYWFHPHYYSGLHAAAIFAGVHGLRVGWLYLPRLRRLRFLGFALLVVGCCTVARSAVDRTVRPLVIDLARSRQAMQTALQAEGGRHLVFVRRRVPYNFHFMWVYNDADIDRSPVVWAHDRGWPEDQKLIAYYGASRRAWLLVESYGEPRLTLLPFGASLP